MAFDMASHANTLLAGMAKAQAAGQRGYNVAAMPEAERVGYNKALLDCIDHLEREAATEQNAIIAAGLRVAARELGVFRAEKLRAVPQ